MPEQPLIAVRRWGGCKYQSQIHAGSAEKPVCLRTGDVFNLQPYGWKASGKQPQPVNHDRSFQDKINAHVKSRGWRIGKRQGVGFKTIRFNQKTLRADQKFSSSGCQNRFGRPVKKLVSKFGLHS